MMALNRKNSLPNPSKKNLLPETNSNKVLKIKDWKMKPRFFVAILYMDVSENSGIPKLMVYNGKPYQNGWFGGTIIFGNTHIHGQKSVSVILEGKLNTPFDGLSIQLPSCKASTNLWRPPPDWDFWGPTLGGSPKLDVEKQPAADSQPLLGVLKGIFRFPFPLMKCRHFFGNKF